MILNRLKLTRWGLCAGLTVACSDTDPDLAPGADAAIEMPSETLDAGAESNTVDASTGNASMNPDAGGAAVTLGNDGQAASDSGMAPDQALEIAGEYHDDFGDWVFTDATWELRYAGDVSAYVIEEYSNDEDYFLALADEDNLYDAGLYQKLMWIPAGDDLYTCTATATGVTTLEQAREASADPEDLEVGCGGFPWSLVRPGLLVDE